LFTNAQLKEILKQEGIPEEEQGLDECENIVVDGLGFFSFRMLYGLPYLVHFWVDKNKRSPGNFYKMVKTYKDLLRSRGFKHTIINAPESGTLTQFVEGYTKKKPYSRQHGQNYYLAGVDDHGKKTNNLAFQGLAKKNEIYFQIKISP
jgi:predicted amino acid racemase